MRFLSAVHLSNDAASSRNSAQVNRMGRLRMTRWSRVGACIIGKGDNFPVLTRKHEGTIMSDGHTGVSSLSVICVLVQVTRDFLLRLH